VAKERINVVALTKTGERYIFLYDDWMYPALLQTLGRFAANPDLSFSWEDAATLVKAARDLANAK